MKKEEFLSKIKELTGIDMPDEKQEALITELASAISSDEQVETLRNDLKKAQDDLAKKTQEYTGLQERYKKRFWSGDDGEEPKPEPEKPSKPTLTANTISIGDLFS